MVAGSELNTSGKPVTNRNIKSMHTMRKGPKGPFLYHVHQYAGLATGAATASGDGAATAGLTKTQLDFLGAIDDGHVSRRLVAADSY